MSSSASPQDFNASLFPEGLEDFEMDPMVVPAGDAVPGVEVPAGPQLNEVGSSGSISGSMGLSPMQEGSAASGAVTSNSVADELENDERALVEKAIKIMEENLVCMKQVANASSANERLDALSKIVKNKKATVDLMSYKAEVMKKTEHVVSNKRAKEKVSL